MPDDSPVRILVVEHHTLFRKGLVNLLNTRPEFEVAGEATNGREALRKARELTPDIILMDVSMPGVDLQATRRIQQEIPHIKIVMLTVADDDQAHVEAVKSGAQEYVRKDVEPEALFGILTRVSRGEEPAISQ